MDIRKTFETDESLEEHGTWVTFGGDSMFLIARFGNKRHRELMERLRAPHRALIASGRPLPNDIADKMLIEAAANTILLNWRGVTENGVPVPYSIDKAREYLTDLKDFRNQVDFVSTQMETFRRQAMVTDAGNSSPSSTG
jgi:hypothetical protein